MSVTIDGNEDMLTNLATAQRTVAMLRRALRPFAHHSLPGFWTESDRVLRIRVTEGQLCRAWMALNNPHWMDEEDAL